MSETPKTILDIKNLDISFNMFEQEFPQLL